MKAYNPATKETTVIATIPVSTKYTAKDGKVTEAEDGLLGIVTDPNFATNHWIYLYYSEPGDVAKNVLTRYELRGSELVMARKKYCWKWEPSANNAAIPAVAWCSMTRVTCFDYRRQYLSPRHALQPD